MRFEVASFIDAKKDASTMSLEIYNARIDKLAKSLPGRDEAKTDTSRGYVGWGPGEDAACADGRTVVHADWQALLADVQTPAREIHDFYFEAHTPSKPCECCAGSGKNKDYAELAEGFYRFGGGRWAGWGNGKLYQNEIDALLKHRRLMVREGDVVTPDNLKKYLFHHGHDAINRWILIPVRAENLGISTVDCFECVGTGLIPTDTTKIMLHMWTFDPLSGTSRVDTAKSVAPEELDEVKEFLREIAWEGVKRRFGWVSGDNMHPDIRYEENFRQDPSRPFVNKGWWDSSQQFRSFDHFKSEWGVDGDPDLNLVFDYRIVADQSHLDDNPFAHSELPEEFTLQVMMTHPRKGADRMLVINGCTPEDSEEIKNWLLKSFEVHGRHFAWAVGRAFGNEVVLEGQDPAEEENFLSAFMRP